MPPISPQAARQKALALEELDNGPDTVPTGTDEPDNGALTGIADPKARAEAIARSLLVGGERGQRRHLAASVLSGDLHEDQEADPPRKPLDLLGERRKFPVQQ